MTRAPIGEVMVRLGLLVPAQVDQILDLLRTRQRGRFGELAMELGFIDEGDLARAVAEQFRLPMLGDAQVASLHLDLDTLELLPASFMRRERLVPTFLDQERGVLSLLTADPTALLAIEQARELARARQVRLFVTTRRGLVDLLARTLSARDFEEDAPQPQLAPRTGDTVVFEPDPARLAALRRLQTVDGGRAQLVSDPEQVTSLLGEGGAWRVVHRAAVRDQVEAFRAVWRAARPGLWLQQVQAHGPEQAAGEDPLAEDWLSRLRDALVGDHPRPASLISANKRVRAIADELGLPATRARALTWLDLHLRLGLEAPAQAGLSELTRALDDRRLQGTPGPDLAIELLWAETELCDIHPAVRTASERVDRRQDVRVQLLVGNDVEAAGEDLFVVLDALAETGAGARIKLSGRAELGRIEVTDGQLVRASFGDLEGPGAVRAMLGAQGTLHVAHTRVEGEGPALRDLT